MTVRYCSYSKWRLLVAVAAAGLAVGVLRLAAHSRGQAAAAMTARGPVRAQARRSGAAAGELDRNLAYWDSAAATANEIRAMVKQDLQREYGLQEQGELLSRLVQAVRKLQDRQPAWEARLRTTAPPTPHKKPPCVNNPPMHYERTGDMIRECSTYKRTKDEEGTSWQPTRAVILTLKPDDDAGIRGRVAFLQRQGINAAPFRATDGAEVFASDYSTARDPDTHADVVVYSDPRAPPGAPPLRRGDQGFLTAGERGYLDTMRRLLKRAFDDGTESLIVLDDDAVMDCAFRPALDKLLNDDRCSAPLRPALSGPKRAGILLLGAAIWIKGTFPERGAYCSGWKITDAEMAVLREGNAPPPQCYNAHSKVFGSYAAVYHRSTYADVIAWIDNATEPFDHIYPALVRKERLVRVAYPSLVIQDLSHTSQIDPSRQGQHNFTWRANIHRWEPVGRYCDPVTGVPLTHGLS